MPEPEKIECSVFRDSSAINVVKKKRWNFVLLTGTLILFLFIFLLFLFKKVLLPGLNLVILPFLLFAATALKLSIIKGIYSADSTFNRVTGVKGILKVRQKGGERLFFIEDTRLTLPTEWGRGELLSELSGRYVEAEITLNDGIALVKRLEAKKGRVVED